jgi:hypothetical protein
MNLEKISNNTSLFVAFGLIIIALGSRLIPHLPNFSPLAAVTLFGAVNIKNKKIAFLIPLFSIIISDLFIGMYSISIFVYISIIAITIYSLYSRKMNIKTVLINSILFFLISNFGVWILHYPNNIQGLIECFTLAIPFYRNSLLGDLFYSGVLYYSFKFISTKLIVRA